MSYIWTIITLQLIIVDESFAVLPEDVTSVCRATTNAIVGQNAAITCKFGTDISKLRSDVFVFHYRQDPESVLDAFWLNGKPKVITQLGYELKGNITTSLELEIPHVTPEHEGLYACRVSKSSENASTPCTLLVHAMDNTEVTVTSPKFSNDSNNAASPEDESYVFIVPIVLGGVVVATVIIIIFKRETLIKQFHKSCCLTDKFNIATNDPPPPQQVAQVPYIKCANGVEDGSVLTPLCESGDIHMKNTTT